MKKLLLLFCLFVIVNHSFAQPFIDEIKSYQQHDHINPPAKHSILFVGSSSFRIWKDYQKYFPGYSIINRGVGGSSLTDIIRYTNDIILPYQPKQIVIYCGENDFTSSDTVTVNHVVDRFKLLFFNIRKEMPNIPIAFISIKPSPSRWKYKAQFILANNTIQNFLNTQQNTNYINVWDSMLDVNGNPITSIFLQDNLHMNSNGYLIWQKIIAPYLVK